MACPTSSSDFPKPYAGAVSISVMPRSSAVRIVLTASASSRPPHIQPPIDHVPSPMRELATPTPRINFCSISFCSITVAALRSHVPTSPLRRRRGGEGCARFATRPKFWSREPRCRRRHLKGMDGSNSRAKFLLEAELAAIGERLQAEARVPSASLAGGDFLDLAQGLEQQEL